MKHDKRVRPVLPVYRPSGKQGQMVVYRGPLEFVSDGERHVVSGRLELTLAPRTEFAAHISGSLAELHFAVGFGFGSDPDPVVAVPPGSALDPPERPVLPERPDGIGWLETSVALNHLEAGDMTDASRFVIHVSGPFQARLPAVEVDDGRQHRLPFELPGWKLVLAAVAQPMGDEDFRFVVEAVPVDAPADPDTVERLRRRLFMILSLLAGRELGVGPLCGLDREGLVVWADWGPPRLRHGRPGIRWCPDLLVAEALPALSRGFGQVTADAALERVLDRAISHLLAAGGGEVLDVRIPVSCSGLELLGWAILQRHGWIGADVMSKLPAAARARLLIQWAGIPVTIPDGFDALRERTGRVGQPDWAGPEVLFNVRNALMHPPKRLDEPEWPSSEELFQSWQLATWYLELVVLRVLGYEGSYWSRLRLGRRSSDVEPVPWASGSAG